MVDETIALGEAATGLKELLTELAVADLWVEDKDFSVP